MARRLDETQHLPPPLLKREYPWDRWTDGGTWEILSGVDFTGKAEAFRNRLYDVAKRRGMRATAHAFRIPRSVTEEHLRGASASVVIGGIDTVRFEQLIVHLLAGGRVHAYRGGQVVLDPARLDVALIERFEASDEDRPEGVEGLRFRFVRVAADGTEIPADASPPAARAEDTALTA